MSASLVLSGYDLSDEGPGRTVNEDATLVREDLGLFAIADGAGGRGKGDVAANLALRSIENYIGSTVRKSHMRPDFDVLGNPEQARRLSAAVHQAHHNVLEVVSEDPSRAGMATTVVATLVAPRTNQIHVAHVGDSRCYRLRHGRLELLTVDDSIANEILQTRPETPDDVLERLPRNSVVRALGMDQEFRVSVTTHDLIPGDQFLLCTDGLTSYVDTASIWEVFREQDPPSILASELLSLALAARGKDNISVLIVDCHEQEIDPAVDTRRYNEVTPQIPAPPEIEVGEGPNSAEAWGPEILSQSDLNAVEEFDPDSEFPTRALPKNNTSSSFEPELVGNAEGAPEESAGDFEGSEERTGARISRDAYALDLDDIEFESDMNIDLDELAELEAAESARQADATGNGALPEHEPERTFDGEETVEVPLVSKKAPRDEPKTQRPPPPRRPPPDAANGAHADDSDESRN